MPTNSVFFGKLITLSSGEPSDFSGMSDPPEIMPSDRPGEAELTARLEPSSFQRCSPSGIQVWPSLEVPTGGCSKGLGESPAIQQGKVCSDRIKAKQQRTRT